MSITSKMVIIPGADFSGCAIGTITPTPTPTPVVAPTITISNLSVTITANDASAIYYTTDGSTPTASSTLYSQSFNVVGGTTIKAIAKYSNGAISDVTSKTSDMPNVTSATLENTTNLSFLLPTGEVMSVTGVSYYVNKYSVVGYGYINASGRAGLSSNGVQTVLAVAYDSEDNVLGVFGNTEGGSPQNFVNEKIALPYGTAYVNVAGNTSQAPSLVVMA